jgi:signal transduction histidine kinase
LRASREIRAEADSERVAWLMGSLSRRFLLVASLALLLGMLAIGSWVSRLIVKGVIENSAAAASLYVNSLLAPHLQGLATSNALTSDEIASLQRAVKKLALREPVDSIKVWKQDGLIVYSSNADLSGRKFPGNPFPQKALDGIVSAEYGKLYHPEDATEYSEAEPHLEVYTPVRNSETGEIIAILEFHEQAGTLSTLLDEAQLNSWMTTGVVTLLMIAAMFSIVSEGSRTIDRQKDALSQRVNELSTSLRENDRLRRRVQRSARKATGQNDRMMRQLGYDLHDGVAQLIGLALLRLGSLAPGPSDEENLAKIQRVLSEALQDVRNLAKGLLMPEIHSMKLEDALRFMTDLHQTRTGTTVESRISQLPEDVSQVITVSLCRFVQEALNNAFRHANGKGQKLSATLNDGLITIEISDAGPGINERKLDPSRSRIGLLGLRYRIESIGGMMTMNSEKGRGTSLVVTVPLTEGKSNGK